MAKRPELEETLGGESVCYTQFLCDECGAVLDRSHEQPCALGDAIDVPAS